MDNEVKHEWGFAPPEEFGSSSFSLIRCSCGFPPHNQTDIDEHSTEHGIPSGIERIRASEIVRQGRSTNVGSS